MSNKEKKPTSTPSRDPEIKFDYAEFYQNTLSLPQAFKDKLKEEGLDYRFLNRADFVKNGNTHRSHWKAYVLKDRSETSVIGVTPDGHVQRGDLILGVRAKNISSAHKNYLKQRSDQYKGHNKAKAEELRRLAKDNGLGADTTIHEGYEENE